MGVVWFWGEISNDVQRVNVRDWDSEVRTSSFMRIFAESLSAYLSLIGVDPSVDPVKFPLALGTSARNSYTLLILSAGRSPVSTLRAATT